MASYRRRSSAWRDSLQSEAGVSIARTISAATDSSSVWTPDGCKKGLPATIMHMHACKSIHVCTCKLPCPWQIRITISMGNTDRGTRSFNYEGKHADRMIIVARGFTHPGGVIDVWWRPEIIGLLMSAPFSDVLLSNLLFSSWSCNIIACKRFRMRL